MLCVFVGKNDVKLPPTPLLLPHSPFAPRMKKYADEEIKVHSVESQKLSKVDLE